MKFLTENKIFDKVCVVVSPEELFKENISNLSAKDAENYYNGLNSVFKYPFKQHCYEYTCTPPQVIYCCIPKYITNLKQYIKNEITDEKIQNLCINGFIRSFIDCNKLYKLNNIRTLLSSVDKDIWLDIINTQLKRFGKSIPTQKEVLDYVENKEKRNQESIKDPSYRLTAEDLNNYWNEKPSDWIYPNQEDLEYDIQQKDSKDSLWKIPKDELSVESVEDVYTDVYYKSFINMNELQNIPNIEGILERKGLTEIMKEDIKSIHKKPEKYFDNIYDNFCYKVEQYYRDPDEDDY